MKNDKLVFSRSLLAAAVALTFPTGAALADDVQDLINPNTREVAARLLYLNTVNPQYRQYTGLNDKGVNGSLDLNFVNRSVDGTWFKLQASDLGLTSQALSASVEKQGDWKLGLDHSEFTKFAPYTLNSKVAGVGTNTLTLNQDFRSSTGLGGESDLKLKRTATSLSGNKQLLESLQVNFSFKTEDKRGEIMGSTIGSTWNRPTGAAVNYSTMFFTPQPQNYTHNQFEFSLDYFTKGFQVSGGYYGSFFNNANSALNITPGYGSLPAVGFGTVYPAGAYSLAWVSLAPDNRMQQLFLSGAYEFTDKTRGTFKLTKARAEQDDGFIPPFGNITVPATYNQLNPPGVPYANGITNSSLGGLVDTTSVFGQLTSRLSKQMDLTGSWRYEKRDDKTPQRLYFDSNASTEFPNGAVNEHESHTANRGKLELSYRLPEGYRLTGGYDYDQKKTPDAYRESVTDQTFRADLRKTMSETLNGSVMLAHSNRNGGDWNLANGTPAAGATTFSTTTGVAAPLQFADRKRDKIKFMLEWTPTAPLSTQFFYEYAKDKYPFAPPSGNAQMGMTQGKADLFGFDLAYKITDNWKANAFYSINQNKTHQNEVYTPRINAADQNCTGVTVTTACSPWTADLNLKGEVFGAGLKGNLARWDVGADYMLSKDTTAYNIAFNPAFPTAAGSSVPAGAGVLPDTKYVLNRLRVNGTYAVSKETKVRLDYIYDQRKVDDYTWQSWTYSDGTRVNVNPNQKTHLVGVTVMQSF